MKKKAGLYLLIIVVISIWGLIIRMIVRVVKNDSTPAEQLVTHFTGKNTKLGSSAFAGVPLKLNFNDPFLKNESVRTPVINRPQTENKAAMPVNNKPDMGFIKFEGFIVTGRDKKVLLVSINGHDYMTEPGQTEQGVGFISFTEELLTVKYHQKTFKIHKE